MKSEKLTIRSLTKPANVATALHPIAGKRTSVPAMFDRCIAPMPCRRAHYYAGGTWLYCPADELICTHKQHEFKAAPNVPVDTKSRIVPPHVHDWAKSCVARIASENDDTIGLIATAWLCDEWSVVDTKKPKRRGRTQWRMMAQEMLFEKVAEIVREERPWRK